MKEPGAILIDAKDEDVRGVLYYWPSEDAILSTRIRTTWDLREYQDLIVVDLRSHEVATLLSHVNVNVHTFTLAGN